MTIKTCLIIPCYNEEKRLDTEAFLNFVQNTPQCHLLFVNDGSQDKTLNLLKEMSAAHKNISWLDQSKNQGKAMAIRSGVLSLLESDFSHLGYWDADLATPLSEVQNFVQMLVSNSHVRVVMGSRWRRLGSQIERKFFRHIIGRVFATLASISLELNVYDTQCGAKIFSMDLCRQIFKDAFVAYWLFDVELLFRIKNLTGPLTHTGMIVEYPLQIWADKAGSKLKTRDFFKAPWELWKILCTYRWNKKSCANHGSCC